MYSLSTTNHQNASQTRYGVIVGFIIILAVVTLSKSLEAERWFEAAGTSSIAATTTTSSKPFVATLSPSPDGGGVNDDDDDEMNIDDPPLEDRDDGESTTSPSMEAATTTREDDDDSDEEDTEREEDSPLLSDKTENDDETRAPTPPCRTLRVIDDVRQDPCYPRGESRKCLREELAYVIPAPSPLRRPNASAPAEIPPDMIFGFIHINKAGGTTIKKHLLEKFVMSAKVDGAGFGTFRGFKHMPTSEEGGEEPRSGGAAAADPWKAVVVGASSPLGTGAKGAGGEAEDEQHDFYRCGRPMTLRRPTASEAKFLPRCGIRALWGSLTLGLCDRYKTRPCMYLVVLREPVSRAVSDYNYFCVNGMEARKKWTAKWKRENECPLDVVQFYRRGLTSPSITMERLTRGAERTGGCGGVDAAVRNLANPCVRFLLLDRLRDGLMRLQKEFGSQGIGPQITALLNQRKRENTEPYPQRTTSQLANPRLMGELKELLKHDVEIYEKAKEMYESQWERPLASCNAFAN